MLGAWQAVRAPRRGVESAFDIQDPQAVRSECTDGADGRNIKMGGMSKEEWIASLKAKGLARKAELDKEREQARLNGGETPEEST